MNKIIIANEKVRYRLDQIESWLHANAGCGAARHGGRVGHINHWLSGDDWLYYQQYSVSEDQTQVADAEYVFVFRDEQVATEFALRFA